MLVHFITNFTHGTRIKFHSWPSERDTHSLSSESFNITCHVMSHQSNVDWASSSALSTHGISSLRLRSLPGFYLQPTHFYWWGYGSDSQKEYPPSVYLLDPFSSKKYQNISLARYGYRKLIHHPFLLQMYFYHLVATPTPSLHRALVACLHLGPPLSA